MVIFALALLFTFAGAFIYTWHFCSTLVSVAYLVVRNSFGLRVGRSQRMRYLVLFVWLFSMFLAAFLRCASERAPNPRDFVQAVKRHAPHAHQLLVEGDERRFCKTCQLFKVGRIHHCRRCKQCVPGFDHHCPWLDNCIGAHNYRLFYLQSAYGCLLGLQVCATLALHLVRSIVCAEQRVQRTKGGHYRLDGHWLDTVAWAHLGLLVFAIALGLAVCISLGEFSVRYLGYIVRNATLMDDGDAVVAAGGNCMRRVFGDAPVLWAVPLSTRHIPGLARHSGFYVDGREILLEAA